MKKRLTVFLVIVAVVAAILLYFYFTKPILVRSQAIEAVSDKSAVVVEVRDYRTFAGQLGVNVIISHIDSVVQAEHWNILPRFVDSLFAKCDLLSYFDGKPMIYALENQGVDMLQLCIVETGILEGDDKQLGQIRAALQPKGELSERTYKDARILAFSQPEQPTLFVGVKNSLLLTSFSSLCVEKAIEVLSTRQSILTEGGSFEQIYSSAGKNEPANIFINVQRATDCLPLLFGADKPLFADRMRTFADRICFDLNSDTTTLKFNGLVYGSDSVADYAAVLASQRQVSPTVRDILPDKTSEYCILAFNEAAAFADKSAAYNALRGQSARNDIVEHIANDTDIDIYDVFYPLVNDEICMARIDRTPEMAAYYTVIKLKSQGSVMIEMDKIVNRISRKKHVDKSTLTGEIALDDNTIIPYYKLNIAPLPELLFGDIFKPCSGNYLCFVKNYMVLAQSVADLTDFVYDATLNNTLSTNILHNKFLENFSDNSLLFYYKYIGSNGGAMSMQTHDKAGILQNLGRFGYQINSVGQLMYNNMVLEYSAERPSVDGCKWERRLENAVAIKPAVVVNHNDKTNEILVQDSKNILYLLSSGGNEQWHIPISEPICSRIYQVDVYKNGKLQYLFSTPTKLHIVDRLGNYLTNFPVVLRDSATAALALFDYDNNKNYRILIPCKNNKVYLYDCDGKIVKGWNFAGTEHNVTSEIERYVVDNQDFIVFHDAYQAYFLNRAGELRRTYQIGFKFSRCNKFWYDRNAGKPYFCTTDEQGIVRRFFVAGEQDSVQVGNFSPDHYFSYIDVDGDGRNDFVYADSSRLQVFDGQAKLLMSYTFPSAISSEPNFYRFSCNLLRIGIVCTKIGKVYLLEKDGTLVDGFPFDGDTPFSIWKVRSDGHYSLLVGAKNGSLLNYELKN